MPDSDKKKDPEKKINPQAEEETEDIKRIPLRQVIYVELDDEITRVCDRIKHSPEKQLFLVVPLRATFLQSIVNLRILKQKAKELEKEISIITDDKTGIYFAQQCNISVYDKLDETRQEITDADRPPQMIESVVSGSSLIPRERPTRLTEKKLSISDLVNKRHSGIGSVFSGLMKRIKRRKKQTEDESPALFLAPNRQALFILVIISAILLLTIAYIALPGATIYITPDTQPITIATNITLLNSQKNKMALASAADHTIPSYTINPGTIERKFTFYATGKIFKGENARGKIVIKNLKTSLWTLVEDTRFQTDDGIVFRIKNKVAVPPMRGNEPGTLVVDVVADELDVFGNVAGSRGNIGPSKFSLPGLKLKASQELIYAESTEQMTGGITDTINMISKADLGAAKEKAKKEILASAQEELQNYLIEKNRLEGTKLTLLTDKYTIKIGEPKVIIPSNLENKQLDSFEVTVYLDVQGIAYNKNDLLSIMKAELQAKKNPDRRVTAIDEDNITYRILRTEEGAGKVELTATIKTIEQYEIRSDQEIGINLMKKIKDHVLGKKLQEAEDYIQNLPEINKVEIKAWPFWAPTIPTVSDNVKIIVEDLPEIVY